MEIVEGYDWYEQQKEGLGIRFLEEVEAFFKDIEKNPFTHSYYEGHIRQGVLNTFPYSIVYEAQGQVIIVYSVFMAKQDPSKKRLG
jgi:hypothetical protein